MGDANPKQRDLDYHTRVRAERFLLYLVWIFVNGIALVVFGSPNGLVPDRTTASYLNTTPYIFPFSGGKICEAPCLLVYDYSEFIGYCSIPLIVITGIRWLLARKRKNEKRNPGNQPLSMGGQGAIGIKDNTLI